jgi:hypothetical protein
LHSVSVDATNTPKESTIALDGPWVIDLGGYSHSRQHTLPTVYQAHFWLSKQGSNSGGFCGDEKTVVDRAECSGMAATASLQGMILGFAILIAPTLVSCI